MFYCLISTNILLQVCICPLHAPNSDCKHARLFKYYKSKQKKNKVEFRKQSNYLKMFMYSKTCLKGSPKRTHKTGCLRQVTP